MIGQWLGHYSGTNKGLILVDLEEHGGMYVGYLPGTDQLRIFNDWNEVGLSYAMSAYMRVDRSTIFDEETQTCRTALFDREGNRIT
jgi:hypothetical protein